ncbi:hypothetical protein MBLNU457_5792t1 [Dothideomycetes sp. NU457]
MATTQRPNGSAAPNGNDLLTPALQVGAFTGIGGVLIGGTAGILRSSPAVLFATISGAQCFALGTTYWYSRSTILRAWDINNGAHPPQERLSASAIAGAIAGSGVGLLTRGPRNVLPGGVMFALFGAGGQYVLNALEERPTDATGDNVLKKFARSKWTPVAVLSDGEYAEMLREKLLKVDVEVALIDDRIGELRKRAEENRVAAATTAASTSTSTQNGAEVRDVR